MYLHIGNGESVKKKEVIGIFDLDTSTVSKITRDFINKAGKEGKVSYTDLDLPRSFVLSSEEKGVKVRLSRISTVGLKQRLEGKLNEE